MIPVRKRQPDGQQSHDRVSIKEHIRTIVDALSFQPSKVLEKSGDVGVGQAFSRVSTMISKKWRLLVSPMRVDDVQGGERRHLFVSEGPEAPLATMAAGAAISAGSNR